VPFPGEDGVLEIEARDDLPAGSWTIRGANEEIASVSENEVYSRV
jgi:hypothetical protein